MWSLQCQIRDFVRKFFFQLCGNLWKKTTVAVAFLDCVIGYPHITWFIRKLTLLPCWWDGLQFDCRVSHAPQLKWNWMAGIWGQPKFNMTPYTSKQSVWVVGVVKWLLIITFLTTSSYLYCYNIGTVNVVSKPVNSWQSIYMIYALTLDWIMKIKMKLLPANIYCNTSFCKKEFSVHSAVPFGISNCFL